MFMVSGNLLLFWTTHDSLKILSVFELAVQFWKDKGQFMYRFLTACSSMIKQY